MTFVVRGLAVTKGVAIGRAVLVASSRVDVAHYFIEASQVDEEIARVKVARDAVMDELRRLQTGLASPGQKGAHGELYAMLDVHLMLLEDATLIEGVKHWISDRLYNAEWALTTQLDIVVRQFDEMEDEYLRERKGDLEQVVEKILMVMQGVAPVVLATATSPQRKGVKDDPLVLIAHDLSPSDMLQFKNSVFRGFVTDVGGKTSHTAIVARSMAIPAVVGARSASSLIRQDDWVIIDGDAGVVIANPSPIVLEEYGYKKRQGELELGRLARLRFTPCVTIDGEAVTLMANIEQPEDAALAVTAGAVGVGLFRSEFLFMGRHSKGVTPLPSEEEQFKAYREAVEGMHGLPLTIRTVDIGADKPLDRMAKDETHLNPALGLRAIRWSLSEPSMFLTQLRAILRAAAWGKVKLLVPMLSSALEIKQTLALINKAQAQLDAAGAVHGPVEIGAMIEVPAAALSLPLFLRHFDFLSIGTNDLIQYTLAIDRADESVAEFYDPLHPAVLQLISNTIRAGKAAGKEVSVCGEMAGDANLTRLLLGMGLRCFSMHPAQLLAVKQEVIRSDASALAPWAEMVLASDDPAAVLAKETSKN
jgi:phosphotransferase system enzyme I (PtsI)